MILSAFTPTIPPRPHRQIIVSEKSRGSLCCLCILLESEMKNLATMIIILYHYCKLFFQNLIQAFYLKPKTLLDQLLKTPEHPPIYFLFCFRNIVLSTSTYYIYQNFNFISFIKNRSLVVDDFAIFHTDTNSTLNICNILYLYHIHTCFIQILNLLKQT